MEEEEDDEETIYLFLKINIITSVSSSKCCRLRYCIAMLVDLCSPGPWPGSHVGQVVLTSKPRLSHIADGRY